MATELLDPSFLFPFMLYAETHYRFKYFFSYLRKKEPEVIADAPHRVDPGNPIPLLILAKDADQYPCRLAQINVVVKGGDVVLLKKKLLQGALVLSKRLWWHVYYLHVGRDAIPATMKGWVSIDVEFTLEQKGKKRTYRNDNHRTSSRRPLEVFLASDPLPGFKDLYFGDAHTHSDYTDDQVEFGSPLGASVALCKAMGLSFFCVTDHSYDLDDRIHDYVTNDPALPKWNRLLKEASTINRRESEFKIVVGEEVSCCNKSGRNVHLLLLGTERFYAGSGDGAERWFRTRSELSVGQIARNESGVAFAAHPKEEVSFLQRLLLNRAVWTDDDIRASGISGIQILNGDYGAGFWSAREAWISALLRGERLFLLAGNDAHGNFNRFRQIGIPFFRIREKTSHIFGKMRTGVFVEGALSQGSILEALRSGRSIITGGPVAKISVKGNRTSTGIGGEIPGKGALIEIEALSTVEFGPLTGATVFLGEIGKRKEAILYQRGENLGFQFKESIGFRIVRPAYVRLEVQTAGRMEGEQEGHFCLTNPMWVKL